MKRVGLRIWHEGVSWPSGSHSSIEVHLWSSVYEGEQPGRWPSMHELDCGELVSSRWVIDVPESADETSLSKRPKPLRYTSTLGKADVTEVVAALLKINAGIAGPSWSMLTTCDGSSDELEINAGDFKLRLEWSHDIPKGWVGVEELIAVLGDFEYCSLW